MSPSIAAVCGQANPQFTINYHQQNRDPADPPVKQYCGAAAAQMVLESLGAGVLDQDLLYNSNHSSYYSQAENWHAAPDGIVQTLQAYAPGPWSAYFQENRHPSEDAISRKVCWSIHGHGIAPIVLVYRNKHWVVVTGFTADADPVASDDTNYNIELLDIQDPAPQIPDTVAPFAHVTCTDGCASGTYGGLTDQVVTYRKWQRTYLAPVLGGHWHGDCVVICDGDPIAPLAHAAPIVQGGYVDNTETIIQRALEGLERFNLVSRDPWASVLDPQLPPEQRARPGVPVLVEEIDGDTPQYYYIVPFVLGDRVPFLVNVGASQDGEFDGSISAPVGGTTHFSRALDRDTVGQVFDGREVTVNGETVTLRPADLYQHLVWRPCAESLSPYWPFYRFDVGGPESGIQVYVRIDGELFPELHDGKGM